MCHASPASRWMFLWLALLLSCARGRESGPGAALSLAFPAQAARVLSAPRRFSAGEEGFQAPGDLGAALPGRGDEAARFALGSGFEVRVREVGMAGRGARASRAVAYARAGGASFWAADDEGYEEWLMLEPGAVRRDAPVAVWEIEGAAPRQRGEAVALCDARGVQRLSITAPEAYAAGGRRVSATLRARGASVELWVDAEGEAVLVDPAWRRVRNMSTRRTGHTATLLTAGEKVIVAGGRDENMNVLATAEVFDPTASTWTTLASMNDARVFHTATLLADGRVLVAGGATDAMTPLATAELYDPTANTWMPAAPMAHPRAFHTATLLADGQVLVAGGDATSPSSEVYDPVTGTWSPAGDMTAVREQHAAATLADGRVLVTGGTDGAGGPMMGGAPDGGSDVLPSAEIFDPATSTWKAVTPMSTPRTQHTLTLLPLGSVLAAGGLNEASLATAEIYDPGSDTWRAAPDMSTARIAHTATLIPGPDATTQWVLVVGGLGELSSEVYEPENDRWSNLATLNNPRADHTATALDQGHVLVAGGMDDTAEMYEPTSGTWAVVPPMSTGRAQHTATVLESGLVLVAGGDAAGTGEVLDPTASTWTSAGTMTAARVQHTATLLADGLVLIAGGQQGTQFLASAEVYDPSRNAFRAVASMSSPRSAQTATPLPDGTVLVVGGNSDAETALSSGEVYDPARDTWTALGQGMSIARAGHTATLLPDGRVLVLGGVDGSGFGLSSAEVYDPATGAWTRLASASTPIFGHTATLVSQSQVLVAGGALSSGAQLFDVTANTWTSVASMSTVRSQHTATLLPSGLVLVAGGDTGGTCEAYDPTSQAWTTVYTLNAPRHEHAAVALPGGVVLVTGGEYGNGAGLSSADLFAPESAGAVCTLSIECGSGACVDGICCNTACDVDCTTCSVAYGAPTDGVCTVTSQCNGYACDRHGASHTCFTACTTSDDCASTYACDVGGQCVSPASTNPDDACAFSRAAPSPPSRRLVEPVALLLAGLALLRRRKERVP